MFHGMLKSKPINNAHLDACHTVDLSKYRCNLLQYTRISGTHLDTSSVKVLFLAKQTVFRLD